MALRISISGLKERLHRLRKRRSIPDLAAEIMAIGTRCARLPDLDSRTIDAILDRRDDRRST